MAHRVDVVAVQPAHALEVARVADVHRVGDRLHRGARLEAAGRRDTPARRRWRWSPRRIASIGRPARFAISPAVRLPKLPLGVQTTISRAGAARAADLRDARESNRPSAAAAGPCSPSWRTSGARASRSSASANASLRQPMAIVEAAGHRVGAHVAVLRVEHRQLRFLRRAHAAVGIEHDDAGVRHAVKGVGDGAAGVAGRRGKNGQRLVAACRATPSAAPSCARRRP